MEPKKINQWPDDDPSLDWSTPEWWAAYRATEPARRPAFLAAAARRAVRERREYEASLPTPAPRRPSTDKARPGKTAVPHRAQAERGYSDQRAGERTTGTRATPTPRPAPSTPTTKPAPGATSPTTQPAPKVTATKTTAAAKPSAPRQKAKVPARTAAPPRKPTAGPRAPVGVDKAIWSGIVARSLAKYGRPPSADAAAATYLRRMKTPEERSALAGIRSRSAKRYGASLGEAAVLATYNRTHPKKQGSKRP